MGFRRNKNKTGVYAYLDSATNTTTTSTPDEFVPILGTFINSPIEGFILGAAALVYADQSGVYFEIDWHASFKLAAANKTIHFGIAINGETLIPGSPGVIGTFAKNNNQVYAVSGTLVVSLNQGDTIQLQITSDSGSSVISVEHFTTTISKFFVNY